MIVIINGASGAGKTFLLNHLSELPTKYFVPIKKYTTRDIRSFEDFESSADLVFNQSEDFIKKLNYKYRYDEHLYGIDKSELKNALNKGEIPVVIVRDFEVIRQIKSDFVDTKVLFIIGANGETLISQLSKQGRSEDECSSLFEKHNSIVQDYMLNIDVVDGCIINYLYDKDLYLKQFIEFTKG